MITIHFERFILLQFFLPYFWNNHNNNEKKNGTDVTIFSFISILKDYFCTLSQTYLLSSFQSKLKPFFYTFHYMNFVTVLFSFKKIREEITKIRRPWTRQQSISNSYYLYHES